jgi:hypothetical protein
VKHLCLFCTAQQHSCNARSTHHCSALHVCISVSVCLCALQHCFGKHDHDRLVCCDYCEEQYHTYCVTPVLTEPPSGAWYCQHCIVAEGAQAKTEGGVSDVEGNDKKMEVDYEKDGVTNSHGVSASESALDESDQQEDPTSESTAVTAIDGVAVAGGGEGGRGGRSSKRSKAGAGYNPHAFSNSQELPNVSKYLQQEQLQLGSGRPPVPTTGLSTRGRGGRRRRGGRGGRRTAGSRGGHARTSSMGEAECTEGSSPAASSQAVPSHSQSFPRDLLVTNGTAAADTEMSCEPGSISVLPHVTPKHLPMNLQGVTDVVEAVMVRHLRPKETRLLDQFRRWAPVEERQTVRKLLDDQKKAIIKRYLLLHVGVLVEHWSCRALYLTTMTLLFLGCVLCLQVVGIGPRSGYCRVAGQTLL